ncbi:MAG: cobalt-precorrin 5A hydrolase [Eubacteriales bacterium]|nr:cobalt-precorrin 5A hydrolase [Eubacteriales bacterium]
MKLEIISFTKAGSQVCSRLVKGLREAGHSCAGYVREAFFDGSDGIFPGTESVGEWTRARFDKADGLIYIGAAGIAVRAVAPCLRDKMTDPAVVAVDEQGRYAVALLSGHVGGANRLAEEAAAVLGALPVVTTASDGQGLEAVDLWARERGLLLADRALAVKTAAALVNGESVGFRSDYPLTEPIPRGYTEGKSDGYFVWVTSRLRPDEKQSLPERAVALRLVPQALTVGIGCRRGVPFETVRAVAQRRLEELGLDLRAVGRIATIDLKKDEPGLLKLAEAWRTELCAYPAAELEKVKGTQADSEFVRSVTGVGNVCERAALLGAGADARLLAGKYAENGVTVAVAESRLLIGRKGRTEDGQRR